jgi:hypothetical protein
LAYFLYRVLLRFLGRIGMGEIKMSVVSQSLGVAGDDSDAQLTSHAVRA